MGIAFILWWTGMVATPQVMRGGLLIEPGAIWQSLYLPILLMASLQLAVNIVTWLRPRWTVVTSLAKIALAILFLAIIAGLQRAGSWVVVNASHRPGSDAAGIADSVNLAVQIAFVAIAVGLVVQILTELWKLLKMRRRTAA